MSDLHVNTAAQPTGTDCVECLATNGWWLHLGCAECRHIGCWDSSPSWHASDDASRTGHTTIRSFEPGEDWFWVYASQRSFYGPELAPPLHPARPAHPGTGWSSSSRLGAAPPLMLHIEC